MGGILTGDVSEGLLSALYVYIAREELCGVLRVGQGTIVNTVFFEIGVPIFAFGGEAGAAQSDGEPTAAQPLDGESDVVVECGTPGGAAIRASQEPSDTLAGATAATPEAALEAARRIILSMFEWKSGEYLFDPDMFALRPIDLRLEWTAAECIEQGMRLAAEKHTMVDDACIFQAIADIAPVSDEVEADSIIAEAALEGSEYAWADSAIPPVGPDSMCAVICQSEADAEGAADESLTPGESSGEEREQGVYAVPGTQNWDEIEPPVFSDVWMVYARPDSSKPTVPACEAIQPPKPAAGQQIPADTVAPELAVLETSGPGVSMPTRIVEINRHAKAPVPMPELKADSPSQAITETNPSPVWTYASDAVTLLPEPDHKHESQHAVERVIGELYAMLNALEGADFYKTLGVDRLASSRRISLAYAAKKRVLTRYRSQWPENQLLGDKLDALLRKYDQACETLGDLEKRSRYDQPGPAKPVREAKAKGGAGKKPLGSRAKPRKEEVVRNGDRDAGGNSRAAHGGEAVRNAEANSLLGGVLAFETGSQDRLRLDQQAVISFQQGLALYKKRDLHMALYFLREAVRLDPSKVDHHYYLGLALALLSKARKRHVHDAGCHVTCTLDGFLFGNQRVRREAVKHLAMAAELDPNNSRVLKDLATLYEDAGMPRKAEYYLDRAMLLGAASPQHVGGSRSIR